jgi:hypothetical protein
MFYWKIKRPLVAIGLVSLAVVLGSCGEKKHDVGLYPIDSIVEMQVVHLAKNQARLQKITVLGSDQDTTTFVPKDSLAWSNELEIFHQLEMINKPLNRASYLVDDNLYDPGSNLTVKAFTSLEDLPVRSLRVFYSASVKSPRKIEAIYQDTNALYESSRALVMEFQQVNSRNVLTGYSIDGGQKIILGDTVSFKIKGKIETN